MKNISTNFPTGDAFSLALPDTYDPVPDANGIVTLAGRPRAITHIAYSRRPDPRSDSMLRHRFDVSEGIFRVEVYETLDAPPETLRAYWRFPNGTLATFLQDDSDCGLDLTIGMRQIIASTRVSMSRFQLPVVRLRPPLMSGDLRSPFEREMLIFSPRSEGADAAMMIKITCEPPWIIEAKRTERWQGHVASSLTTSLGVTVSVAGEEQHESDLERTAQDIAESLLRTTP
jgi:hypothetical protein